VRDHVVAEAFDSVMDVLEDADGEHVVEMILEVDGPEVDGPEVAELVLDRTFSSDRRR